MQCSAYVKNESSLIECRAPVSHSLMRLILLHSPGLTLDYPATTQSPFSTSLMLSAFDFLLCLPSSLHGKCNTGTKKKVLPLSAIPANMFHQAINAATIPKEPPARFKAWLGVVTPFMVVVYMYPVASMRKVSHTVRKREEKATVDLRVRSQRMKVKMNQPCCVKIRECVEGSEKRGIHRGRILLRCRRKLLHLHMQKRSQILQA
jgi:hypothetical protein